MHIQRIKKLQSEIKEPILIKKKENLTYLAGKEFSGGDEGWLLVTPSLHKSGQGGVVFFGTGLEKIDAFKTTASLRDIGNYIKPGTKLSIENYFTYGEGDFLKYKLPKVKFNPIASPIDKLRVVKDASEIALIQASMEIVEKVFGAVKIQLKKKQWTEKALAQFIEAQGMKYEAEAVSFPAIVASGANAAVPHHVPGDKKLVANESIILDFGFKYHGYCSDFTRTVFLKSVPKKLELAYNQTERAYLAPMDMVNLGSVSLRASASERSNLSQRKIASSKDKALFPRNDTAAISAHNLHQKAVDILTEQKLEKYFIHSLGHGTGLEIHEKPNLYSGSKDMLTDGMVFSIEPGVYFPRIGGIRIEDLVYLKNGKIVKFINVSTDLKNNII